MLVSPHLFLYATVHMMHFQSTLLGLISAVWMWDRGKSLLSVRFMYQRAHGISFSFVFSPHSQAIHY